MFVQGLVLNLNVISFVCLFFFYHGDGVEGSVSANTEVGSGNIVGDSGRNNNQRNAQFLVLLSRLHHLQTSNKCLLKTSQIEMVTVYLSFNM